MKGGDRREQTHLENLDDLVGDRHNPNHRDDKAHRAPGELGGWRVALIRKRENEDCGGEPCDASGQQ